MQLSSTIIVAIFPYQIWMNVQLINTVAMVMLFVPTHTDRTHANAKPVLQEMVSFVLVRMTYNDN